MRQTETGLYEVLETLLRGADKPMTCVEMFDKQEVKDRAATANRVSDYLGHLWRRGKVTREPAPHIGGDASRWAYSWRKAADQQSAATPEYGNIADFTAHKIKRGGANISPKDMLIEYDDESVTIRLPTITITIKHT